MHNMCVWYHPIEIQSTHPIEDLVKAPVEGLVEAPFQGPLLLYYYFDPPLNTWRVSLSYLA